MRPRIIFEVCFLAIVILVIYSICTSSPLTRAQTAATTLQAQVDQTSGQITELKAQIAQLQTQLDATTKQKQTLQSAVQALNLNIQKITTSVALTQAQITQTDSNIHVLSGTIATTTSGIAESQSAIADSLRQLDRLDNEPLITTLLSGGTLSSFFDQTVTLASLRVGLENRIQDLASLKTSLQTSKSAAEQKRAELATLQQNLSQQKQGLAIARDAQNQLLQSTKNNEANYQAQIAQKKAQETQSEQDLINLAAQLHLTVNPSSLPPPGPVLAWPIDNTSITQYFGNTPFATQNPSIYNGHGHTGIDLAASPGTPIKAARSGIIMGTGNTDIACPGASFGKWIFIQHDDGLSTMYAHLSVILVSQGQQVTTGQVIAYSDTTGYATGPHLHFGVYATQGTVIKSWPNTNPRPICTGKIYTMPVAALQAYLNPLTYLPPLGH